MELITLSPKPQTSGWVQGYAHAGTPIWYGPVPDGKRALRLLRILVSASDVVELQVMAGCLRHRQMKLCYNFFTPVGGLVDIQPPEREWFDLACPIMKTRMDCPLGLEVWANAAAPRCKDDWMTPQVSLKLDYGLD